MNDDLWWLLAILFWVAFTFVAMILWSIEGSPNPDGWQPL